jgi:FKBP-type peptidyl-prolyl cis-trans isomerase FkpA
LYSCSAFGQAVVFIPVKPLKSIVLRKVYVFLAVVLLAVSFSGCLKDKSCRPRSVQSESAQIEAYATMKGFNVTKHTSGLYYEILDAGSGAVPANNSRITITYRGELLDGYVFDQMTAPNTEPWYLSNLIEGWRIGVPLIKEGGRIRLIIPSALAYGCSQVGVIPADSPLFFDISLIRVQ